VCREIWIVRDGDIIVVAKDGIFLLFFSGLGVFPLIFILLRTWRVIQESNFEVFDSKLSEEDMKALQTSKFFRSCVPVKTITVDGKSMVVPRDLAHPQFPFEELLEKFKDIRKLNAFQSKEN